MLQLQRIIRAEEVIFQRLIPLYTESFPEKERRDMEQLKMMLSTESAMYFHAVKKDGILVGLLVYWDFETFYYIEHLAVFDEWRNQGIGSEILSWVTRNLNRECILEVEPDTTDIAIRRICYYQRNGFRILDKTYLQPSYHQNGEPFPLWIMGNGSEISLNMLKKQLRILKEKVYGI